MEQLWNYLYVFLLSMVPIIELRGAIPLGVGLGLEMLPTYFISVVGNFLPVPFILLFIRRILEWMKTTKRLSGIALWLEKKAACKSDKVMKYAGFGLFLFVAIPLPGTGAWTGSLVAALLNMKKRYTLPSILLGVLVAGLIMALISWGVVSGLDFLL